MFIAPRVVLAVSMLQRQNGRDLWWEPGRARRLVQKQKRWQKAKNAATSSWSSRRDDDYEREERQLSKQRKCMAILRNAHILMFIGVWSLTHSFNIHFAILLTLLTLCCIWLTVPKHMQHLLTVIHMCLFKCYWDMCETYTVNTWFNSANRNPYHVHLVSVIASPEKAPAVDIQSECMFVSVMLHLPQE